MSFKSIQSREPFSLILHTETVVAVQELARFRKRTLPSHFLLNCAITCVAPRGKISLHSTKVTPKAETTVSAVIGTYLAVAKAEKHSHTETLEERNYILPRHRARGKHFRRIFPSTLLQFLSHEIRSFPINS